MKNNRCTDEHYYNKKQHITNSITNNISKQVTTPTNEHVLNI